MDEAIYILCALTSLVCGVLLLRGFRRSRARLLLWSGLCFTGLAVNNLVLYLDLAVFPQVDLELWRSASALASLLVLLFGLIWDSNR